MNSYPRQMFDGRSAEDLFLEEFQENPWRKLDRAETIEEWKRPLFLFGKRGVVKLRLF